MGLLAKQLAESAISRNAGPAALGTNDLNPTLLRQALVAAASGATGFVGGNGARVAYT